MKPMLDNLELPQVQEITTFDRRALSEHKPPGMAGSLLQNLGRQPTCLILWGVATGPDSPQFTQKLEQKFRDAKPVPFTADIVADAKIDLMLIENVRLQEVAGRPERHCYTVTLNEFIKPVEPEDVSALDTSILDDARNLLGGIPDGLDIGQAFATGLEKYVSILGNLLAHVQKANQGGKGA